MEGVKDVIRKKINDKNVLSSLNDKTLCCYISFSCCTKGSKADGLWS